MLSHRKVGSVLFPSRRAYCGHTGAEIVGRFYTAVDEAYPQYVEELKGMADGAKISFDDVCLLLLLPSIALFDMTQGVPAVNIRRNRAADRARRAITWQCRYVGYTSCEQKANSTPPHSRCRTARTYWSARAPTTCTATTKTTTATMPSPCSYTQQYTTVLL